MNRIYHASAPVAMGALYWLCIVSLGAALTLCTFAGLLAAGGF